jgi:hypothetical protein
MDSKYKNLVLGARRSLWHRQRKLCRGCVALNFQLSLTSLLCGVLKVLLFAGGPFRDPPTSGSIGVQAIVFLL